MIKVICNICDKELEDSGSLIFSPPDDLNTVTKWHVCRTCWHILHGYVRIVSESRKKQDYKLRPIEEAVAKVL